MADRSPETHIALMEADLKSLRGDLEEAFEQIHILQEERNKALLWGVLALGGAVLSLLTFIVMGLKSLAK